MPSVQFSFRICQNYPAPVGFLPEPDLEKVPDSGTALICAYPQLASIHSVCREVIKSE